LVGRLTVGSTFRKRTGQRSVRVKQKSQNSKTRSKMHRGRSLPLGALAGWPFCASSSSSCPILRGTRRAAKRFILRRQELHPSQKIRRTKKSESGRHDVDRRIRREVGTGSLSAKLWSLFGSKPNALFQPSQKLARANRELPHPLPSAAFPRLLNPPRLRSPRSQDAASAARAQEVHRQAALRPAERKPEGHWSPPRI
jgi:hypothetical protein